MAPLLIHAHIWQRLLAIILTVGLGIAVVRAEEIVVTLPDATPPTASARTADKPQPFMLHIEDVKGTYSIPYIQSSRELRVRVDFTDPAVVAANLSLVCDSKEQVQLRATRDDPSVRFANLAPGEYSLECRGLDGSSQERCRVHYDHIGIGTVVAALGDSITEGYKGRGFKQDDLKLTADRFPTKSVSLDGRNFPQYAPTSSRHLPNVNCFESWMTALNNSLASAWRQPVFIANEGWGGITTERYLAMMRGDAGWKKRMLRLEPQVWLIHLGVNDERATVPPADVHANFAAMVDILIKDYRAKPAHIFICTPSYDYHRGAAPLLRDYTRQIDALIKERKLTRGPDFFAAFSQDRQRWYGNDPVHPNLEGMARMAKLWSEALARQLPSGPQN